MASVCVCAAKIALGNLEVMCKAVIDIVNLEAVIGVRNVSWQCFSQTLAISVDDVTNSVINTRRNSHQRFVEALVERAISLIPGSILIFEVPVDGVVLS